MEDEKIQTSLKDENQKLIKEKHVTAVELAKCKRDLRTLRTKAIPATQKKVILREVMSKFGYTEKQLDCFVRGDWVRVKGWTDEDVKFALGSNISAVQLDYCNGATFISRGVCYI